MTGADELARERSGVQMINPAPYNAEALPGALVAEITPTALHYIRSNFALPDTMARSRWAARSRTRGV